MRLLINAVVQLLLQRKQRLLLRIHIEIQFRLLQRTPVLWFLHHPQQRTVPRLTKLQLRQKIPSRIMLASIPQRLRLTSNLIQQQSLLPHQPLHHRLVPVILLRIMLHRPADDQRRPRLVDQHAVHFIDNRKPVPALHLLIHTLRQPVVPQIVKTKLRIRPVRHIARVLMPPQRR